MTDKFSKYDYILLLIPLCTVVLYVVGRSYPAGLFGFYYDAANEIYHNNYRLPVTIPDYTKDGVPFAYPPLGMYIVSILRGIGVKYKEISIYYPSIVYFLCSISSYFMVLEVVKRKSIAAYAPIFLSCTPLFISGHITAGGVVRSTALLFSIISIYFAWISVRNNSWFHTVVTGVCLSITVHSHPIYAYFTTLSVFLIIILESKNCNIIKNICILVMSSLFASLPWLLWVQKEHGIDIFFNAAGTHGGLFQGYKNLIGAFHGVGLLNISLLVFVISIIMSVYRRRWTLSIWSLVVVFFVPVQGGRGYIPLLLIMFSYFMSEIHKFISRTGRVHTLRINLVVKSILVSLMFFIALSYLTKVDSKIFPGIKEISDISKGPTTLKKNTLKGHRWINNNIEKKQYFVVIGNNIATESFPFVSSQTLLLSTWGTEWLGYEVRHKYATMLSSIRSCKSLKCVASYIHKRSIPADYIVIANIKNFTGEDKPNSYHEGHNLDVIYQQGHYQVISVK